MMTWWRMGFEQLEYILRKGSKPLKQSAHGQFYTVEQEIHVLITVFSFNGHRPFLPKEMQLEIPLEGAGTSCHSPGRVWSRLPCSYAGFYEGLISKL